MRHQLVQVCLLLAAVSVPAPAQDNLVLAAESVFVAAAGREGIVAALRAAFTEDAVFLWPGAPVAAGADAARLAALQPALDSLHLALRPLAVHVARDASLGATWGVAVGAARAGGGQARVGRYIAAWRREGGGWRLAALLLGGLAAPQAAVVPDGMPRERPPMRADGPAAAFAAADLAFARLAADSGAAVAFARWAAPDVMLFGAGGVLVRGPADAGRLVEGPADWRWHPVGGGAAGSGDLGWTVGESVITTRGGAPAYGKYITLWVRQADGSVRYTHDGGTVRPAP
jgi:ketosteroid isomerase-like protein